MSNLARTPSQLRKQSFPYNDNISLNLYDAFMNNESKTKSFNEFIKLSTSKKPKYDNNNKEKNIYNEYLNKLNYFNQILNFKINQSKKYEYELLEFQRYYTAYLQDISNFNSGTYNKLKEDFEQIKYQYDSNILNHADQIEWDIFYNSTTNFFDYLKQSLCNIKLDWDWFNIGNKIIEQGEKIISLNDKYNYISTKKKLLLNNKRRINDHCGKGKNQKKTNIIKSINYVKKYGKYYKESNKTNIKNKERSLIYGIKVYLSKEENSELIQEMVREWIDNFIEYFIVLKDIGGRDKFWGHIKIVIIGEVNKDNNWDELCSGIISKETKCDSLINIQIYKLWLTPLKKLANYVANNEDIAFSTNYSKDSILSIID